MGLGPLRDGSVEVCDGLQGDTELGHKRLDQQGSGADALQLTLRFSFRARLTAGVPLGFRPSVVRLWQRVLASLPSAGAPTRLHQTLIEVLSPL